MKLELIRHTWGTSGTWEELFPAFKSAGYDGVETPPPETADRSRIADLLAQHGLTLILQIASRGRTVEEHLDTFERNLHAACACGPRFVNAHSGRDAWSEGEAERFFARVLELEAACGIPVVHETHRGRILYNPWVTARMLERFPELKLCCDFSHWVCVSESLLDDQQDIIRLAAGRCHHLHARVGHEQGPQVSDPAAPEYATQLAAHEAWWQMVWDAQRGRGDTVSTLVPEFGPPPYAPTHPGTNTPLRDVAEVCDWMARRQKERFLHH
ncbi:MAG: sugar phosphate isomerase/epimerase [Verrucomicrobia bacterium]|nr:sugar phosphate isomerase/epimerase [Verrucomicrobiota bacterium]